MTEELETHLPRNNGGLASFAKDGTGSEPMARKPQPEPKKSEHEQPKEPDPSEWLEAFVQEYPAPEQEPEDPGEAPNTSLPDRCSEGIHRTPLQSYKSRPILGTPSSVARTFSFPLLSNLAHHLACGFPLEGVAKFCTRFEAVN